MIYRIFTLFVSGFLFVNIAGAQEVVKENEAKPSGGAVINKEVKSEGWFQEPNVKAESEINSEKELKEEIEESPLKGEPIIGAEIFEEQTPAQPEQNKKALKKDKKKKIDVIEE